MPALVKVPRCDLSFAEALRDRTDATEVPGQFKAYALKKGKSDVRSPLTNLKTTSKPTNARPPGKENSPSDRALTNSDFSRHLEKSPSNQGFTPSLILNNLWLMTIANGGIRLGVCGNLAIA